MINFLRLLILIALLAWWCGSHIHTTFGPIFGHDEALHWGLTFTATLFCVGGGVLALRHLLENDTAESRFEAWANYHVD